MKLVHTFAWRAKELCSIQRQPTIQMYNENSEYLDFLRRKDVVLSTESYRPIEEPILNPDLDWSSIYTTYLKDNLVVVDNYL